MSQSSLSPPPSTVLIYKNYRAQFIIRILFQVSLHTSLLWIFGYSRPFENVTWKGMLLVTTHFLTAHLVSQMQDHTESSPHRCLPFDRWYRKLLERAGSIPRRRPGHGSTHMHTEKQIHPIWSCSPFQSEHISEHMAITWISQYVCTIIRQYRNDCLFLFEHHENQ